MNGGGGWGGGYLLTVFTSKVFEIGADLQSIGSARVDVIS